METDKKNLLSDEEIRKLVVARLKVLSSDILISVGLRAVLVAMN